MERDNSLLKERLEEIELSMIDRMYSLATMCRSKTDKINLLDTKIKNIEHDLEKIDKLCKICSQGVAVEKCGGCLGELCSDCKRKVKECPFCRQILCK